MRKYKLSTFHHSDKGFLNPNLNILDTCSEMNFSVNAKGSYEIGEAQYLQQGCEFRKIVDFVYTIFIIFVNLDWVLTLWLLGTHSAIINHIKNFNDVLI